MQESGGKSLDVMQASESKGLPPNSITDPHESIKVGVANFASVYKAAKAAKKMSKKRRCKAITLEVDISIGR